MRIWAIAVALVACSKTQSSPGSGSNGPAAVRVAVPETPAAALSLGSLKAAPGLHVAGVDIRWSIDERLAHHGIPAVGVAVVDHDTVDSHAWGVREAGKSDAVDTDTRFQAASISKPVTAVAAMRLVEQGKLDLDADVAKYLHTWKPPAGLTLRKLLSHTAGVNAPEQVAYVKSDGSLFGYTPGAKLPTTLQILEGQPPSITTKIALLDPAPKGFEYSGGGYMIIQAIIEDTTGKPFADAMADLVLVPAGMTHSTFADAPGTDDVARAHDAKGVVVPTGWYVVAEKSVGGLWTTPGDLAHLLHELIAAANGEPNKLMTKATFDVMRTGIADAKPTNNGYMALGIFVSAPTATGDKWFSHNGHNPGYHATMVAIPERHEGFVIMSNREGAGGLAPEVWYGIALQYGWPESTGMAPKEVARVATERDQLAACAGTYFEWGFHAEIRADGDKLYGKIGTDDERELYAIGPYKFADPVNATMVEFTVEEQKVKSLKTKGALGKHEAIRVP